MDQSDPSVDRDDHPPGLAALIARAERAGKGAPPVERWHPQACGDIDMVIHADGSWSHEGTPIARPALVRLFSSVLRKDEDGETYLVTPVEMMRIRVEDVAFAAVEMDRSVEAGEPVLTFRTNVGDVVTADADHPLRFETGEGGFVPYVRVRGRLEARLTRALAFELADHIETDANGGLFVRSRGANFRLPHA
mgnify:CR=1 FL=1